MLYEIVKAGSQFVVSPKGLAMQPPSEIGLLERDIEQWLAEKPDLLLPNEQLLVIARSVAGQAMADILALDALGRLVVVEIKRNWSDRTTVGQLLEYAARLREVSFDELQAYARRYMADPQFDLYIAYQQFAEGSKLRKDELARSHRVFIVAPESDDTLRSIVEWLKSFNVPIEFVPFVVYADAEKRPRYLQLAGVYSSPDLVSRDDTWAGHWIFNTNETNAEGAYKRMFEKGVAAIYGYTNGAANLEGAATGDKLLAYVNRQGLRAIGTVLDPQVVSGTGVFVTDKGEQLPDEYHLKVRWEIVPSVRAISAADAAADFGYNLPVRSVFAKLQRGSLAQRLEQELRARAASQNGA